MTREILFRGRRIDNGLWVYGDLIQLYCGRCFIIDNRFGACIDDKGNFINTESPFVNEVIPETVGQFTGLTDKNGVKIFEGDIVLQPVRETRKHSPCVVEFKNGKFMAHYNSERKFFDRYYDFNSYTKVVGNIHDNPELLEV